MLKKASWLKKNISNKKIKVLDASWYLPNSGRNAYREYMSEHISNAFFFDIDKIADNKKNLPHMLPSKKKFEMEITRMGINNNDIIVIYCKEGLLSSPRVWWTFYYFGHKNVFILDGGLRAWKLVGGKLTNIISTNKKAFYKCRRRNTKIITSYCELNKKIKRKEQPLILDARPEARFKKKEEEPRKNIGKGIIPGSKSCPSSLFDFKGFLKSKNEIRKTFKKVSILKKVFICSCGSGVAACNIALSLEFIGYKNWSVYDGSWTEWYLNNKKNL